MRRNGIKAAINVLAAQMGVRLVNAEWGPRGFAAAFMRARDDGFVPGAVIDIGASTGVWTSECREVFPDADYFLVDPLPRNEAALAALAGRDRRLSYWRGALGARSGETVFYDHGDQSSALASPAFPGTPIVVPIRTLDEVLGEHPLRDPLLLKIDVQGFELEVLRGATETLTRTELILVEVNFLESYENGALAHEVIALLGDHGFRILDFCTYSQRPLDNRLAQSDMLFVRLASPLTSRIGWT